MLKYVFVIWRDESDSLNDYLWWTKFLNIIFHLILTLFSTVSLILDPASLTEALALENAEPKNEPTVLAPADALIDTPEKFIPAKPESAEMCRTLNNGNCMDRRIVEILFWNDASLTKLRLIFRITCHGNWNTYIIHLKKKNS